MHRVVTPCIRRTHLLRRSAICIESIGTNRIPFFGAIVLTLMSCVRVIVDAIAQKMSSLRLPSAASVEASIISVEALASQGIQLFARASRLAKK